MTGIYVIPVGPFVNAITYLSGVEIAKCREISKAFKTIIDDNHIMIYSFCMHYEYPKEKDHYYKMFPIRTDWKNLYIITDQYRVAKKRAPEHRDVIERKERFDVVESILSIVELILSLSSIAVNALKITALGWAPARQLITKFLKDNPGKTLNDALTALGMNTLKAPTNQIEFW